MKNPDFYSSRDWQKTTRTIKQIENILHPLQDINCGKL